MTYEPIWGAPVPIFKPKTNEPAIGWWLKFYASKTNTVLPAAINREAVDALGQPLTVFKIKIGPKGITESPSGGDCIPHVNAAYKVALFEKSTDADLNNLNEAAWVVDGVQFGQIGLASNDALTESSSVNYRIGESGVDRTVQARLRNQAFIDDFNTTLTKDGLVDWTGVFSAAIAASNSVIVTPGIYLVDSVSCATDGKQFIFQPGVTLKARSNDRAMFYQSASNCRHEGSFTVDSNSKTGIYGIAVAPADMTQTATIDSQVGNRLPGVVCDPGTVEGVVFQPGPEVSAVLSLNENNIVPFVSGALRSVWLKSPANAGAGQNKNNRVEMIVTDTGSNTGVQIDNGKNNTFISPAFKNVATGSSPNTTPTGFKVVATCPITSAANTNNVVIGGYCSGCSQDIDAVVADNSFLGHDYDPANSTTA